MYKHARQKPRNGFVPQGSSGVLDDGPTPRQRAALAAYNERIEAERVRQRLRNPPGQKVPAEDAAQIAAWLAANKPKKLPKRKATGPSITQIRGALKDGRRITFTRGRSGRTVTFRKQAP